MADYIEHHSRSMLDAGSVAPTFTLHDTPTSTISLTELRGKRVVLVFYPADWSSVCGDELNIFNAALPLLEEANAEVLGISVDGVWSHHAFVHDRSFNFPLLSDFEPKGEVAKRYGVYDFHTGTSKRALFLVDEVGVIAWSHLSPYEVNPGVDGVLDALDKISTTSPSK